MEYNQQRRPRGNYGYRRPMNGGMMQGGQSGCGCQQTPPQNMACPLPAQKPDCGCAKPAMPPKQPSCNDGMSQSQNCGCNAAPPTRPGSCIQPRSASGNYSSGNMSGFAPGMAYVPWQHWNGTYDPCRSLQSGTIFPELDKPFCAAGRCNR